MIEPDEWHGFRRNLTAVLQWRSMIAYWQNEKQYNSDAFRKEVGSIERELAETETDLSHSYVLDSKTTR